MREPTPVYTHRRQCVECGHVSQENECAWTALLTVDEIYCAECDEREFGDTGE